MTTQAPLSLFAVSAPGLSSVVRDELAELGCQNLEKMKGGVAFTGDLATIQRTNRWLRTASRILLRLGSFRATGFPELKRKAARIDWDAYINPDSVIRIKATCHRSRIYHSGAAAERVLDVISDAIPVRSATGDEKAQDILVRFVENKCTLSVDTSGALLHRRGYRIYTGPAPMRETLAAAILRLGGWKPGMSLVDPFCGSGSLPIEAAMRALHLPADAGRTYAYSAWPLAGDLSPETPPKGSAQTCTIMGSDILDEAAEGSRENAIRAGVGDAIVFSATDVAMIEAPETPGLLVANPPYGSRMGRKNDLEELYASFGRVARERFAGWRVALVTRHASLAKATGIRLPQNHGLNNGGIPIRLYLGTL